MFNTDIQQSRPDVGPDPGYRSRLRPNSAFFSDPDLGPESKTLGKTGPGSRVTFQFRQEQGSV